MKKQDVLPIVDLAPSPMNQDASTVSKDSLSNMLELPNDVTEDKPQQVERNKRKRETAKGTILQAVMIEKDLLKLVKHSAFYNEKTISEVINQALRLFFN